MAQKQSWLSKVLMGKDKNENYAKSVLPKNRWELFWDIFKTNLKQLFYVNLLMVLFALPVVGVFFLGSLMTVASAIYEPFSQNIGIGYPAVFNLPVNAISVTNSVSMIVYGLLPVAAIILAVGISGGLNVIRNLCYGENVSIAGEFWSGVKKNYLSVVFTLLFFSGVLFFLNYSINLANYGKVVGVGNSSWLTVSTVVCYILMAFFAIVTMYMLSLTAAYKINFFRLIKNAFILTFALILKNIIFFTAAMIPFIFFIIIPDIPFISALPYVIFLTVGISLMLLIWSLYSHSVFDKYLNDIVPGAVKNKGLYVDSGISERDQTGELYKLQRKEILKNSYLQDTVKPINDEDLALPELPTNFTRRDIEELEKQKQKMQKSADTWAEEQKVPEAEAPVAPQKPKNKKSGKK